jgi:ADP-ribose pyrophosphatase YjhB (NUDIX family)
MITVAVSLVSNAFGGILLGRRTNKEEYNLFGFPGGKAEDQETLQDCCRRELFEETTLLATNCPVFIGYSEGTVKGIGKILYMWYFIPSYTGVPTLIGTEINKHDSWEWWHIDALPDSKECTLGLNLFIKDFKSTLRELLNRKGMDRYMKKLIVTDEKDSNKSIFLLLQHYSAIKDEFLEKYPETESVKIMEVEEFPKGDENYKVINFGHLRFKEKQLTEKEYWAGY